MKPRLFKRNGWWLLKRADGEILAVSPEIRWIAAVMKSQAVAL